MGVQGDDSPGLGKLFCPIREPLVNRVLPAIKRLPDAQSVVLIRVIWLQLTVAMTGSLMALWWSPAAALAAVMGGAIALVASVVFGLISLVFARGRSAGAVVLAFYAGEIGKFAVVAAGFVLVSRCFAPELAGPNTLLLFGVFAATLAAQWVAPTVTSTKF
jgi:F0F1-type ATP synthase assembly protein I